MPGELKRYVFNTRVRVICKCGSSFLLPGNLPWRGSC